MKIDIERVKDLINQSVEYLSEAELIEENGWSEKDIELLEFIKSNDFDIKFIKYF
ncbi:hypothetical protein [Lysinibacillus sp. Bpr_S20]|uniref:hypothetical protein n=1 Tax=Lysinibacillus sp. Bpr_S20 TaxID=2933964 RepID=UPI0020112EEB|nr:hypothetical protein [Lysinibacillus sp. Bpr_S20]MCL1700805.1 hypothetical protein [Lysinibacillus sp. Bpr_S20]